MKIIGRPSALVAVATACALLFQFGACAFSRKPQKVPVTSDPVGARIVVDGREVGTTPLTLSLDRSMDHTIRIERPGYNPVEIMLMSKFQAGQAIGVFALGLFVIPTFGLLGGLAGNAMMSDDPMDDDMSPIGIGCLIGVLAGAATMLVISSKTPEAFLTPAVLEVALEKNEIQARTNVIVLDRDQLKDIRWIRISCAGGGEAGIVAVN